MATHGISIGRSYSEAELENLGVYPTDEHIENSIKVVCSVDHMEKNGLSLHDKDIYKKGYTYMYKIPRQDHLMKGRLKDGLEIYNNHAKTYLVETQGDLKNIHFCYSAMDSVLIDECVKNKYFDTLLASRGLVSFRMKSGMKDPAILDEAIKMNILGIITYDREFGKDNKLKYNLPMSDAERLSLQKAYESIYDDAYDFSIVCSNGEKIKSIRKKIKRKKAERRQETR